MGDLRYRANIPPPSFTRAVHWTLNFSCTSHKFAEIESFNSSLISSSNFHVPDCFHGFFSLEYYFSHIWIKSRLSVHKMVGFAYIILIETVISSISSCDLHCEIFYNLLNRMNCPRNNSNVSWFGYYYQWVLANKVEFKVEMWRIKVRDGDWLSEL